MAGMHLDVDKVLAKMKNLEELIRGGMEKTQECALDCEENEEGCPYVEELKEIMLSYASMSRDIKQWGKAARKTVSDFHKGFDPSKDDSLNIENLFSENLASEQSQNNKEELERSKALKEFVQSIWEVHHSDEQLPNDQDGLEDEEIHIEKITVDKLLCPFTKTEMKQPVRNTTCGHTYDRSAIEAHITRMKSKAKCPVVGCPQVVRKQDLEIDKALARELKKRHK